MTRLRKLSIDGGTNQFLKFALILQQSLNYSQF